MTKNDNNNNNGKNNYSKLKKILLIPVSIKIYPGLKKRRIRRRANASEQ
jgi:hypothetical protein